MAVQGKALWAYDMGSQMLIAHKQASQDANRMWRKMKSKDKRSTREFRVDAITYTVEFFVRGKRVVSKDYGREASALCSHT